MPNRILREGILDSCRINALSEGAELFYRRLMSIVDDFGRYEADPILLHGKLYAFRKERTIEDVTGFLEECTGGDYPLVTVYSHGRKSYLQITDFQQRQRASKYPGPPDGAPSGGNGDDGAPPLADADKSAPSRASRARTTTTTNTPSNTNTTEAKNCPRDSELEEPALDAVAYRLAVDLTPVHPKMSPLNYAKAALERELFKHSDNPRAFEAALRKTHTEHCRYWREARARDSNAFVPLFHVWIRDGYYLHKARASPAGAVCDDELIPEREGRILR